MYRVNEFYPGTTLQDVVNFANENRADIVHIGMRFSKDVETAPYIDLVYRLEPPALLVWAVSRWNSEVRDRPFENVYRRTLDETWRQVVRHFGGNDIDLLGPRHEDKSA